MMRQRPARSRAVITLVVTAAVLLSLLLGNATTRAPASAAPEPTVSGPQLELAADTRDFNPSNIISDSLFFDGWAMSAGDIQVFLDGKGAKCRSGEMPCLRAYRQNTVDQPADGQCAGYRGAKQESAATIIAKVGQACGINPRVLLVLLQKEQSLVSGSTPSVRQYTKATGFACPDTAPCNPAFQGFVSQVYFAARQFQYYVDNPMRYNYRSGRINSIYYNPDPACGKSSIFIENKATAALYIYTPYQPNAAALRAGYGAAPPCGAYGNRNFWMYYTDWFGSTQSAAGSAVVARAQAADTATLIGAATGNVICGLQEGGCFQPFQRGAIYWSPASGAQIVRSDIHVRWAGMKWETGRLGYPTGEQICGLRNGGCFQDFQNGAMYWSPASGAHPVLGSIQKKWASTSWEAGYLGYPTGGEKCGLTGKGCAQQFQGGRIYWSSDSGAHIMVSGRIWNSWGAGGYEKSALGYPAGEQVCGLRDGGCFQDFQKGAMYWSPATGARPVLGAIREKWASTTWETGYLGYPTAAQKCGLAGGGCAQQYQGGRIYAAPTGAASVMVTGPVWDLWTSRGGEGGSLGFPTGDQQCGLAPDGCSQAFQKGTVYVAASQPARVVAAALRGKYEAMKAQAGPLGYPTAEATCGLTGEGCAQQFQGGRLYWTPASTTRLMVAGPVWNLWKASGHEKGALGYPIGDQVCGLSQGGCGQLFQGGAIYGTPAAGTRIVSGDIYTAWAGQGRNAGPLGYPTSAEKCGLSGGRCRQYFQGGGIVFSPSTGTYVVRGEIGRAWRLAVAVPGYPTQEEVCGLIGGGCFQVFQKGHMYWSPTTGAHMVSGKIFTAWGAQGWETGTLGYPTGAPVTTPSTITQTFQGGTLVQKRSTGTVTRK